jgi:hypothetical protein
VSPLPWIAVERALGNICTHAVSDVGGGAHATHARQEGLEGGAQQKAQNEGTAPTPTPLVWEREREQASWQVMHSTERGNKIGGRAEAIVSRPVPALALRARLARPTRGKPLFVQAKALSTKQLRKKPSQSHSAAQSRLLERARRECGAFCSKCTCWLVDRSSHQGTSFGQRWRIGEQRSSACGKTTPR